MQVNYHPETIELAHQKHWQVEAIYQASQHSENEKFFCLAMLPYPSGHLHMGHVRNYTLADVIARYQRMLGKNVLQPIGWDAFGLPAENAAIKHNMQPAKWTYSNIEHMRQQFKRLGFAYDWSREFATCDPHYYHWEQWLFIQLFKRGLAYKKNALVNWDPVDNTVLANEQVVDGRGWRSGALVEQRNISQWFLKITDYAEELLSGLEQLSGWPEAVKTMQKNWIGKSVGLEICFAAHHHSQPIIVYTTRPDTLLGCTYLVVAAQHPLAQLAATQHAKVADFISLCSRHGIAEATVATLEKNGIDSTLQVLHPLTGKLLPVWIANFVLMEYGTGAIMGVPAHDQRDFEFAQKYRLPLQIVLDSGDWDYTKGAFLQTARLINSGEFTGLDHPAACDAIAKKLAGHANLKINYRLRDWGVSRQRYWGAPIPIIYCSDCGTLPVPLADLPVILPEDYTPDGSASPLKQLPDFYQVACPQCGKMARRETDTFDTFIESSWYYARYTCPQQTHHMLDENANYWLPVDQYVGGIEHAVMHLLYARFFHKMLRDLGLLSSDEPFTHLLTQGMVLKDGAKMSKSKGNVINPQALIDQYGADTVRLFIIFAARPELSLEWSDAGIEGAHRFLKRMWAFCYQHKHNLLVQNSGNNVENLASIRQQIHQNLQQANYDMQRQQFNTVVSAAMKLLNLLQEISPQHTSLRQEGIGILLRLLAPITPHICCELWQQLRYPGNLLKAAWPETDPQALVKISNHMIIQINGKLRAHLDVPIETELAQIKQLALTHEKISSELVGKTVIKIIVIAKKLINIVLTKDNSGNTFL